MNRGLGGSDKMQSGLAADDGVALYFIGQKLFRVVSSHPHTAAYRVSREERQVKEEMIPAEYLGKKK